MSKEKAGRRGELLVSLGGGRSIVPAQHEVVKGEARVLVNLLHAVRPERQFSADDACFVFEHPIGQLHFLQRGYGGTLRSSVGVRLSSDAMMHFAHTTDDFMKRLATNAEQLRWPDYQPQMPTSEPAQAVTLSANAIAATQVSTDTYLDFYQFDPSSIGQVVETGQVIMDGVVRVIVPSHVAFVVLDHLLRAAHALQKEVDGLKSLKETMKATVKERMR